MAETFNLSVLTPRKRIFQGVVDTVMAPGFAGDFGVLPGHVAYITAVKPGALILQGKDGRQVFAVGDGFAQVAADKVSIVVSSAQPASEIDVAKVRAELHAAEVALLSVTPGETEHNDAQMQQALALGRLSAAERL